MGKVKVSRTKFHNSKLLDTKERNNISFPTEETPQELTLLPTQKNLFAGIKIDVNTISNKLSEEDTLSKRSFKSNKLECNKQISKKEKIKQKREMLLRKIDTVNQLKKENKQRKKRKQNVIMGDTNALHDALPSLESLIKKEPTKEKSKNNLKSKSIQKASKRNKEIKESILIFKKLMKTKGGKLNPFVAL